MNLYLESSAVLAWLLGEAAGSLVVEAIEPAAAIVTSELTLLESHRGLVRAGVETRISEAQAARRQAELAEAAAFWHIVPLRAPILERAARPFPVEPVRTLDALHLASLLEVQAALRDLSVISLDRRVRENARELGFRVLPPIEG